MDFTLNPAIVTFFKFATQFFIAAGWVWTCIQFFVKHSFSKWVSHANFLKDVNAIKLQPSLQKLVEQEIQYVVARNATGAYLSPLDIEKLTLLIEKTKGKWGLRQLGRVIAYLDFSDAIPFVSIARWQTAGYWFNWFFVALIFAYSSLLILLALTSNLELHFLIATIFVALVVILIAILPFREIHDYKSAKRLKKYLSGLS